MSPQILLKKVLAFFVVLIIAFSYAAKAQDVVDATTWDNKIMAGYQGWFRTPGDRPGEVPGPR